MVFDGGTGALDALLQSLRSRQPDAYRCHPQDPRRWLAKCSSRDTRVVVAEERRAGPVTLVCTAGCPESLILDCLAAGRADTEHAAELAAQEAIVEAEAEGARRARLAEGLVRSWR